jgi:hypothetical protein
MVSMLGKNFGSTDNNIIDISVFGFELEAWSNKSVRSSSLTLCDRVGNSFVEAFMIVGVRVIYLLPQ